MKVSLLAILLLLSLAAQSLGEGKNQSHSVTWGARMFGDMHLERNIITEKKKFMRVVVREYEFYQKLPGRITQIVITDQVKNGNGGYASLISGGPQAGFANIHFKSQRNKGFSFIVDIYGF